MVQLRYTSGGHHDGARPETAMETIAVSVINQVAVVTGASSGIGWELAKALAAKNWAVGVLARREDRLETLVRDIRAAGGTAAWAVADVTERAENRAAIHSLRNSLGPIDLLIANSGVSGPTLVDPLNTGAAR